MLGHYSQMTGQPKLQIFSKALEESYQTALLNGMKLDCFSMRCVIKYPCCSADNEICITNYSTVDYLIEH